MMMQALNKCFWGTRTSGPAQADMLNGDGDDGDDDDGDDDDGDANKSSGCVASWPGQ